MRISDWSSDVCSSDLNVHPLPDDPWSVPDRSAAGNPVTALPRNDHIYIAGGNIDWRIGDGTITYIPGYVRVKNDYDFYVLGPAGRSEEHTSELQSLMRNSYAVFCLKKNNQAMKK